MEKENFYIARSFYSLTVILFYLKIFKISYGIAEFGAIFIMIQEMIKDIFNLIFIIIIFLISYGVTSHSLIYHDKLEIFNWKFFEKIFFYPYLHIYGELKLERIEIDENNACNLTVEAVDKCPKFSWLAFTYFVIYMIIVNILLVNLLIATITNTFLNVRKNAEKWYCYQKLLIIKDFTAKPMFPPPLNLLIFLFRLCLPLICGKNRTAFGDYRINVSFDEINWQDIAKNVSENERIEENNRQLNNNDTESLNRQNLFPVLSV